jgi:hypothetical protein
MATVSVTNSTSGISGKTIVLAEAVATITALWSFNRGASAPFAVNSGAAMVSNLDVEKLNGQTASYYTNATNLASGTLAAARLPSTASQVLSISTTAASVANSAVENTVHTYTLPGNTLGTTRALRITVRGTITNTSGSAANWRLMTRVDGTTVVGSTNISIPNNVTEEVFYTVLIVPNNSTSAQKAYGYLTLFHSAGSVGWVTTTAGAQTLGDFAEANGTSAKDLTSDKDITLVMQFGTASANLTWAKHYVLIELL